MNLIKQILKQVKANKKYASLSDDIIIDEIEKYLKLNPNLREDALDKQAIKEIRKKLHKTYSSFQTKKKRKRYRYLEELKQAKTKKEIIKITNKLLLLTISTKERIDFYPKLYKQIFKITGKPKTIADFGAGLNLLSFPLMNLDSLTYYSYDIDNEDIKFLNIYFKIMNSKGLNGKASILDIRKQEDIKKLLLVDIIFLFKLIDIIDTKNHKPSEQLIKSLLSKTKFIITSFATKTLTRKKMNYPKRKWFELMLKRNNLKFKTFQTDNEIFYIVSE